MKNVENIQIFQPITTYRYSANRIYFASLIFVHKNQYFHQKLYNRLSVLRLEMG